MAEVGVEYVRPEVVNPLKAYNRHIVSDMCHDRHPYLDHMYPTLKGDEVSSASGDRLYPRLVEQLSTPDMAPEKLVDALRTVCDLASDQESKIVAIDNDVIKVATNLLMHDKVEVKREAAKTIAKMALLLVGRFKMPKGNLDMKRDKAIGITGPTLPKLSKLLLSCDDEIVRANVAEAFKGISVFADGCNQIVEQASSKAVAEYLVNSLPKSPPTAMLSACLLDLFRTVASVTMYATEGMRDVFGIGLIGKVVGFLEQIAPTGQLPAVNSANSAETVRQAMRVLWHTGNDARGRKEALKAKGVEVVSAYLVHDDPKIRETAICVLNVLSLETPGKEEVLKHSVVPLAALLHSKDETEYLHETGVQLARCASELPAFRYAFARHIVASLWLLQEIYGTAAVYALCPVLTQADTTTKVQAATAMAHFLREPLPGTGDTIWTPIWSCGDPRIRNPALYVIEGCVGILFKLTALLKESETAAPALECLELLTDNPKARAELKELLATPAGAEIPEDIRPQVDAMVLKTTTQEPVAGSPVEEPAGSGGPSRGQSPPQESGGGGEPSGVEEVHES